jgi:general nucleoside transport system permease protein
LRAIAQPVLTIVGLALILVLTLSVFGLPVVESLRLLFAGAFGDRFAIARTAVKATPLVLTGLGMVVAWRAGMYNIGGEGQFVVGGLAGATVARLVEPVGIGGLAELILVLCGCAVGGALWAWIAGWLHVRRGVQVVISTILLNFIAVQFLAYAVSGPLKEAKRVLSQTNALPEGAMLWRPDRQTDFHAGVIFAILVGAVFFGYLYFTKGGFRLRLVGDNARTARANLIDAGATQIRAMLLSGALCGLAGGVEFTGIQGRLDVGFPQQWGFLAIPVALLGGLHPLLTVLSAYYFGALFAGSGNLAGFSQGATAIVYVIQGVVVLGVVGLRALIDRKRPVQPEGT